MKKLCVGLGLLLFGGPVWVQSLLAKESALSPAAVQQVENDLAQGRWRAARQNARALVAHNKKSAEAWTLWGRACAASGQYGRALRRYKRALVRDPHHAPAYYGRGEIFEKKKRLDEAANEYQAAIRSDTHFTEAQSAWARVSPPAPVTE